MISTIVALLAASTAIASPIVTSYKYKRATVQGQDFEIVNLARNLESLELNYWNQGLNNYSAADFDNAGYKGFYNQFLKLFRDQEIAHFTVLNEAAGGNFQNCTYTFPVSNPKEFITLGQVVTSVGEGAFLGALGNLTAPSARQTAGEIIGNEARQNSKLRETIGLDYFNAVNFDTPLTASQAYSLAKPFFNCPSSNAPINFKLIPPIMASFVNGAPGNVTAGAQIKLMWDGSKVNLGPDVHIQFLSDMYSVAAPLNQSASGMGTTTLPQGMNGTTFIVATNFNGQGPIPDAQNFAVGYIVVA